MAERVGEGNKGVRNGGGQSEKLKGLLLAEKMFAGETKTFNCRFFSD